MRYLFLFIFILFTLFAQAQDKELKPQDRELKPLKYTFALQPLYLFNSGIRFDFETRIKETQSWLQISPSIYYIKNGDSDYDEFFTFAGDVSSLFGSGLEVNYKYFFNPKQSWYVAGGLSYTFYRTGKSGTAWGKYTENGLEYWKQETGIRKIDYHKTGLNTYIGYQIPSRNNFVFDMFVGTGLRVSEDNDSQGLGSDYNGMLSFGYSGMVIMTGIRIGFGVRK